MIRLFIACLAIMLVSSCLDSHEEVWINADASGKAQVRIALPLHVANANGGEKELKALITDYFDSTPAFTSHSVTTSVTDDQMVIDVLMTFDDIFDLKDPATNPVYEQFPDAADDLLGTAKVEIDGSKLNFLRTIDLTKAIPGSVLIPKDQLKGHKLTTIIHLPNLRVAPAVRLDPAQTAEPDFHHGNPYAVVEDQFDSCRSASHRRHGCFLPAAQTEDVSAGLEG